MREYAKLTHAKSLRQNMTEAEQKLWFQLRAGRFYGYKFRRQSTIGTYIVDFACMHPPLIIELDGGQHAERIAYDKKRDEILKHHGYTILRFWNHDIADNMDGVLLNIKQALEEAPLPHPSPARGRGEMQTMSATHG